MATYSATVVSRGDHRQWFISSRFEEIGGLCPPEEKSWRSPSTSARSYGVPRSRSSSHTVRSGVICRLHPWTTTLTHRCVFGLHHRPVPEPSEPTSDPTDSFGLRHRMVSYGAEWLRS